MEGIRQRNAALDALFYDVKVIGRDEASSLSPWLAAEGAILVVPPSGEGPVHLFNSVDAYKSDAGPVSSTMAIAGVGSSALGSAAFARNVADAVGKPVTAIVSGYGLADIAAEAMGGFFWFGALNGFRHSFEALDRLTETGLIRGPEAVSGTAATKILNRSRDMLTTLALLSDPDLSFDLLIGHSKGNLVISEALFEIGKGDRNRLKLLARNALIVTVSARIAMPPAFARVIDVMGAWDWFGGLNSRSDIPPDHVVPRAWHHTNTEIPAHLPVTETLRKVL